MTRATESTLADSELEKILREREEEERQHARLASKTLSEGNCPVCDGSLVSSPPHLVLLPFVKRPALKCEKCELETQPSPNAVGWSLAMVISLTLALGGMSAIFSAQRISDPTTQKLVFLGGALLFGGGLFLGYGVHGAGPGSTKLIEQRILHKRRGRAAEDDQAGPEERSSWVQENLEAVVVAVILALIIRQFAMEAFVIPTGSMAPTLLGDHFRIGCDTCGNEFPVSKNETEFSRTGQVPVSARCPQCDERLEHDLTPADVYGGHKILVNKFIYNVRPPRRYEVIVFKYPRKPWRNYIKRLVGLPGETIEIRNGDLFASGELARKPDHVQDGVWIPVHDSADSRESGSPRWRPVKEGEEPPEVWSYDRDGARIECNPVLVDGAPETWLAYTRTPISDDYGYNRGWDRGPHQVADLRVRARVTPGAVGSVVRLAVVEGAGDGAASPERVVTARFEGGDGEATFAIELNGKVMAQASAPALKPGAPTEVALCYSDDQARLQIGGETLVRWTDENAPGSTKTSNVRLSAAGQKTVFEHLRIDRDVFYVPSVYLDTDPTTRPVKIPEGSYFVMGDNSPNSEDGRKWGFVREGHLIGRAFLVFWPVVPFEIKLIR